jgi:hypothetical protein
LLVNSKLTHIDDSGTALASPAPAPVLAAAPILLPRQRFGGGRFGNGTLVGESVPSQCSTQCTGVNNNATFGVSTQITTYSLTPWPLSFRTPSFDSKRV